MIRFPGSLRGCMLLWCALALSGPSVLLAGPGMADELPAFRRGMWEFHRKIEGSMPQDLSYTKCTDPGADMKKQKETMGKACTYSPVRKSGNTFAFTADCTMKGAMGQSKTSITVESETSYTVSVDSKINGQVSKETLRAKRTGDCPK